MGLLPSVVCEPSTSARHRSTPQRTVDHIPLLVYYGAAAYNKSSKALLLRSAGRTAMSGEAAVVVGVCPPLQTTSEACVAPAAFVALTAEPFALAHLFTFASTKIVVYRPVCGPVWVVRSPQARALVNRSKSCTMLAIFCTSNCSPHSWRRAQDFWRGHTAHRQTSNSVEMSSPVRPIDRSEG